MLTLAIIAGVCGIMIMLFLSYIQQHGS